MSNEENTPVVPKRRFPEFRNAGEWKRKYLRDYLAESRVSGSTGDLAKKLTVKLWGGGVIAKDEATQGSINTRYYRRSTGQFIYSKLDFLNQAFGLIPEHLDGYESTVDLPCFDISGGLNSVFLLEYVKRREFYERVGESADGSRIAKRINAETFLNFPVYLPPPREQQKIADCLTSLDELIAAQARKVDALKTQKKGLMQQLFPREGEVQPQLRFPEFRTAGEWEERKAASLFTNRAARGEEGLPIYSVTMNDGMVKRDSLERKVDDIGDAAGNKRAFKNDIAYNMMRMWQGALGVAPEDCLVSPAYVVLAPKKDAVPQFFQYMLKLPEMLLLLTSHSRGLTKDRLRLYFDDFARMTFRCPSPQEQQRIADFLTSLDECIAAQSKELEALKTHKNGLMQQLFPSAEVLDA